MVSNIQDRPPENLDRIVRGGGWKITLFQTVVARQEWLTSTSSTLSLRNPFATPTSTTTTTTTTKTTSEPNTTSTTTTTATTTRHSSKRSTTPTSTHTTCSVDIPDQIFCIISSLLPTQTTTTTTSNPPSSSSSSSSTSSSTSPSSSKTPPPSSPSSSRPSSTHASSSHTTTSSSSIASDPPTSKPHSTSTTTPTKTSPTASSLHPSHSSSTSVSTPPPLPTSSQRPSHTSPTSSVSKTFSTPSSTTLLPFASSTRIPTSHITFVSVSLSSLPSSFSTPLFSSSPTSIISSALPTITITSTLEPTSTPTSTTTSSTILPHVSVTTYDISTSHNSGVTTSTTSGGMLRTNVPGNNNNNSFAHNAGAIAGITVGALIALAFIGLWIFLTLRRRKNLLERELSSSSEQVNISPHGGWRSPLEDGDDDDDDPARYANILAQLRATGAISGEGESGDDHGDGDGDGDGDGNDALGGSEYGAGTASVYSALSAPPSDVHYPYMTGFGQAAETMRDENAALVPAMMMVDGAPLGSHRRSLSGGLDSPTWFVGQNMGYLDANAKEGPSPSMISSHEHLSTSGKGAGGSGSKNASYEEDIFHPARSLSSQQLIASSSSDIDSSTGRRLSIDGKKPSSAGLATPPTSFSLRQRTRSDHNSLRSIIGRLRGSRGSSPEPLIPDDDTQSPSPSATPTMVRFPESSYSLSTSQTPYAPLVSIRSPTPPSSLLRPQSPGTPNFSTQRPAHSMGDRLWPRLTLPPVPSPAVSDDSHDIASEGLLDPRLPWRLGQTRADSTTSLRDHEDYSRPIGALFVHNGERSRTSVGTNNTLET